MIDFWAGTLHAKIIEMHLKNNDLENLAYAVKQAEEAMYDVFEDMPEQEPVTDEMIVEMGRTAWTTQSKGTTLDDKDVF